MNKVESKTSASKIASSSVPNTVKKREMFPKAICLEYCQIDVPKECFVEVFRSLKAFSNEDDFNSRTPHPVHLSNKLKIYKKYAGNNKIMSIDIKNTGSGRGSQRLLFYHDKESRVYKVLALCTERTH